MVQKVIVKHEFEAGLHHATTGKFNSVNQSSSKLVPFSNERRGMGSACRQLCPRYRGTLTPTAPTAIRL